MQAAGVALMERKAGFVAGGERARVYRVGKLAKRVYRPGEGDPQLDFYWLRIAGELFPNRFLKPVKFTLLGGKKLFGAPSKAVLYTRLEELDEGHKTFVKHALEKKFRFCDCRACVGHAMRTKSRAVSRVAGELSSAGLEVNDSPHNVAFTRRGPLFLSIEGVDYPRLGRYIRAAAAGEKRERLLALLEKAKTLEAVEALAERKAG